MTAWISHNAVAVQLTDTYRVSVLAAGVCMALCMGAIGFLDDYIKVVKKRNLGLTARQKTFMQLAVSAAYLATLCISGMRHIFRLLGILIL